MPKCLKRSLVILLFLFSSTASAWWETPHMLVSDIAYQHLNAEVKTWVDELMQVHAKQYPKTPEFVSAAVWADDIKREGNQNYSTWHYVTLNFYEVEDPMPTRADFPQAPHAAWGIEHDRKILSRREVSHNEQAMALRRIIHWVGDLHQPMHAATQITPQNPKGDAGGNGFKLHKNAPASNLHGLWDSGMNGWVDLPRPLSQADHDLLRREAKKLLADYPPRDIGSRDPIEWALESHKLAKRYGYQGIEYKGMPDEAYMSQGAEIANQQIVLAGLRLARVLNEAYAARQ